MSRKSASETDSLVTEELHPESLQTLPLQSRPGLSNSSNFALCQSEKRKENDKKNRVVVKEHQSKFLPLLIKNTLGNLMQSNTLLPLIIPAF